MEGEFRSSQRKYWQSNAWENLEASVTALSLGKSSSRSTAVSHHPSVSSEFQRELGPHTSGRQSRTDFRFKDARDFSFASWSRELFLFLSIFNSFRKFSLGSVRSWCKKPNDWSLSLLGKNSNEITRLKVRLQLCRFISCSSVRVPLSLSP